MAVISTLAVNIIAKTGAFEKGVRRSRGSMQQFNNTIRRTRQFLTGLIVGTGVIRGFQSLLKVASEAQEQMAKFTVVFGRFAKVTEDWARSFGGSVGRAFKDIIAAMAELQDIFVPLGFARKEATKMSKSLVQLAVDVASFNERADIDVQRAFASAIVGSHRAVRQFGIAISEARLQQFAFREGIEKSFANLTDIEKAYLRYKIIINDTKDAQGDAIRTQDSYANQLKRTQAVLTNLKQSLGEEFLPIMVGVLKWTQAMIKTLKNMNRTTVSNAIAVLKIVAGFSAFLFLVPKIIKAIKTIVIGFKAMATASAVVQGLSGPAGWAALVAGATLAAAAVVGVNLAFEDTIRNMEELSSQTGQFAAVGNQIVVTMNDVKQSIANAITPGSGLVSVFTKIREEILKLTKTQGELELLQLQRELGGRAASDPRFKAQFAELARLQKIRDAAVLAGKAVDVAENNSSFAGAGSARIIRNAFVSVTGLQAGTKDPLLTTADAQLIESEKQTALLERILNEEGLN